MLRSAHRTATIPVASAEQVLSWLVLASFLLLLVQDKVHPIFVFLLELYLAA